MAANDMEETMMQNTMDDEYMMMNGYTSEKQYNTSSDSDSDLESIGGEDPASTISFKPKRPKFSKAQVSCLDAYHKMGMTSTGKKKSSLIYLYIYIWINVYKVI